MVLAPLLLLLGADNTAAALPGPPAVASSLPPGLQRPDPAAARKQGAPGFVPLPLAAEPLAQLRRSDTGAQELQGGTLVINGQRQQARWEWRRAPGGDLALWLPLEVLQGQLGVSSRTLVDGSLDLEWFGQPLLVPPAAQRSLDDEVAVDVASLLAVVGVQSRIEGDQLHLELPPSGLLGLRTSQPPGTRRVVFDLSGPALVRRAETGLWVSLSGSADQIRQLSALGLRTVPRAGGVEIAPGAGQQFTKVFTLGGPHRLVVDLAVAAGAADDAPGTPEPPIDPRLQALLGRELRWERQVQSVGGSALRINSVVVDPSSSSLQLRTLTREEGMQGLSSLAELARRQDALVAINGGYFNRVRRLPLGALREGGRWLSGPILNRGVVAWSGQSLPAFGRLQLQEWVVEDGGGRWPLTVLNSGYVQRGLSRYTSEWGPAYQSLSGGETAVLLQDGVVVQSFDTASLGRGVRLPQGATLLVARGGTSLPWGQGQRLRIESRPSSALGQASSVMGGGPLLLQNGQVVLNGAAEGFGDAFLRQGAPRTVIGSDGRRLWLVTLQGVNDAGPTLAETAWVLQRMGLRDALNLDGGSSTGLVMGGLHTVKGRGVAGSVHNGLGLVPSGRPVARLDPPPQP
jgi:hypothetical protein